MRRWLTLLAALAAIAVTGTALAMTASESATEEKEVTETTAEAEEKIIEVEEPVEPKPLPIEDIEEPEKEEKEVREEPDKEVEVGDHTPPEIAILYPENGQVFETNEAVFEGTSEPGAAVYVNGREADVGENGEWRIVLELHKGENHVTAKAIDEAGNKATDTVTVIYKAPEPKVEEPKEEPPKEEKPPKEEEVEWEFSAHQVFGECNENPPYDVFWGTGKPGSLIIIESEYSRNVVEINEHGDWEVKVYFEGAPAGKVFAVYVVDKFGHQKVFEFVHNA